MEQRLNEMIGVLENQYDVTKLICQKLDWILKEIQESKKDENSRIEYLLESILEKLED